MIIYDPYASKNLAARDNRATINAVVRYLITDYSYMETSQRLKFKPFEGPNGSCKTIVLYGLTDSEKDVPPITQPLYSKEHNWGVLDLRTQLRVTGEGSYEIRNDSEYRLSLVRYNLSTLWYVGKSSSLYSFELPHFAFATWVSDNLTTKFGLDMGDKATLRALAYIFYAKQFRLTADEDELDKLIIRGNKEFVVADLLREVYQRTLDMETIEDFCVACFEVTGNVRLKGLNFVTLSNVISNNWLGQGGRELTLLALEHPPTWASLVYIALTQKAFKRSFVTAVVEKHSKRGKDQEFIQQVERLTKGQLED